MPDPKQSAQWNRGAYLVEGLGHCSMCHTAINVLGGSSESKEFEGGMIPNQNWYAPSLTSNREAGLGDWSIKDIAICCRSASRIAAPFTARWPRSSTTACSI